MAVIYAIADILKGYAPPITAGKLRRVVAVPKQAPGLITVVPTVIVVITAIAILDTSPIGTGESCRLAGVKCWWGGDIKRKPLDESIVLTSKTLQLNKMDSLSLPSQANMAANRTACKKKKKSKSLHFSIISI